MGIGKAIKDIFVLIFCAALINLFVLQVNTGWSKESWQITEWLINYQGGFVRRGLLGEVVWQLHQAFGFDPYLLIVTLCFAFFVLLVVFFVVGFVRRGYPLILLPSVFLLGGPILNNYWVRKDVLSILFFAVVVYLLSKREKMSLVLANTFLVIMLLIHESIGFYGLPFIYLYVFSIGGETRNLFSLRTHLRSVSKLLPGIVVFGVCLHAKGNLEVAISIWNSWKVIPFPNQMPGANPLIPAAIAAIYWSLKQGISLFYQTLHNFSDGIYAPIAWILIGSGVYFVVSNLDKLVSGAQESKLKENFDRKAVSTVLIWQGVCVAPLCILGWDYGRWLFIWTASSFVIMLLVSQKELINIFPQLLSRVACSVNKILDKWMGKPGSNVRILYLFLGAPQYGWRVADYLQSTPLFVTLRYVSDFLQTKLF